MYTLCIRECATECTDLRDAAPDPAEAVDLLLAGRVALVTAASRGLGRACAAALAAEGVRVAASARDAAALERLAEEAEECPGEIIPMPADLGEPNAAPRLVDLVEERFGRLDALVVSTPGPPAAAAVDADDRQWHAALEMNLMAPIRLTRAALPGMQRRGYGRIVYIGTIGVRTAQPDMVLSNSTRLALMGYAKTLSFEVAAHDILVNMVAPGPIETERMEDLYAQTAERLGMSRSEARQRWLDEVPLRRAGRPEDLASIVALLVSPACAFITGAVLPIDGGKSLAY
jgi:3-oxoacyl-[acyl-carrier protein] reductase